MGQYRNPTAQEIAVAGTVDKGIYRNPKLGLSVTPPDGWGLILAEGSQDVLGKGKEIIGAGRTQTFKKQLDQSVSNTAILLQAKTSDPKAKDYRVLALGVERVPEAVTLDKYLESSRTIIRQSPITDSIYDTVRTRMGGKEWAAFDVTSRNNGVTIKQTYFISLVRGAAIFFILTGLEGNDQKAMKDSIATIHFDN